jgi:cytoskeletal protein RodZ
MREGAATIRDGARSLGAQFAAVRQRRGLTIEKASSETHIRVQRLHEIERDDFSRFAHPSYARMYAMDYAKYLGIPISRIRRLLPDAGECGTEGYQYLQDTPCNYMRTSVRPFRRRRRVLRALTAAALVTLLSFGGLKVWITVRNIERLGLNRMAREDKAALAVPDIQKVDTETSVAPEGPSNSGDTPPQEGEVPQAEVPMSQSVPVGAESAFLVGMGQSAPVR